MGLSLKFLNIFHYTCGQFKKYICSNLSIFDSPCLFLFTQATSFHVFFCLLPVSLYSSQIFGANIILSKHYANMKFGEVNRSCLSLNISIFATKSFVIGKNSGSSLCILASDESQNLILT